MSHRYLMAQGAYFNILIVINLCKIIDDYMGMLSMKSNFVKFLLFPTICQIFVECISSSFFMQLHSHSIAFFCLYEAHPIENLVKVFSEQVLLNTHCKKVACFKWPVSMGPPPEIREMVIHLEKKRKLIQPIPMAKILCFLWEMFSKGS